jgi:hypothetical protein
MATAPNDAPIKVKVGLHVHLYLGVAVFLLSATPFFTVILLNGGADAPIEAVIAALGAVGVLHVGLALTARACSTDKLGFWDGIRLITAYMTFGIGGAAMLVATPSAIVGLIGSVGIATISLVKPQQNWAPYQFQRLIAFFYRHRMYQ